MLLVDLGELQDGECLQDLFGGEDEEVGQSMLVIIASINHKINSSLAIDYL
jgi:hypothetical protein